MNGGPITVGVCLVGDQALELDAFAAACSLPAAFVRERVDEGLVRPAVVQPVWRFGGEELARARRIVRLQRDFEASLTSVAVMLELIDLGVCAAEIGTRVGPESGHRQGAWRSAG
jgi:hypothetical protein